MQLFRPFLEKKLRETTAEDKLTGFVDLPAALSKVFLCVSATPAEYNAIRQTLTLYLTT